MEIKTQSMKKILFVSFSNIGDAVLSLPCLEVLQETFPQAEIDIVVGERAQCVFERASGIRKLWIYEKRKSLRHRWDFYKKLKQESYDLVVDLKQSVFGFLGKHRTSFLKQTSSKHKRDAHLSVLNSLGVDLVSLKKKVQAKRHGSHVTEKLIVIAPGSKSHIKEWPKERFAALADRLIHTGGFEVVWLGDQREAVLVEDIQRRMSHPTQNLAGKLAWQESVSWIKRASLVVTNDSAPLHIADHYGKKVLSFFGPTDPEKYGPQQTPEGVLFRGKFCSPCENAQCRYGLECMHEISVDEAYKRAMRLLEDGPERVEPNILVVRLDRMGDVLLSFPAIRALRERFPRARITALTQPYARSLMERCPDLDDAMVYDYKKKGMHRSLRGYFRLLREIQRRRFDMVFILHPTFRSHLLCYLASIPYRVGLKTRGSFLLTHSILDLRHEGYQHESDNAMDVVRALGVRSVPKELQFSLFGEELKEAEALLKEEGMTLRDDYVAFHAGASCHSKQWPVTSFIELGKMMKSRWGYRVVLVGDERSGAIHQEITQALGHDAIDLAGKTPLPVLAVILKHSKIFISNDSGPVHLGSAVGAQVVSLFGRIQKGLSSKRWRPLGKQSLFLQKDVGCVTCLADKCTIGFECLRALRPPEVFQAAKSLLAGSVDCLAQGK